MKEYFRSYFLLCVTICFVYVDGLELTIPVGVEGNDTVTLIREEDGLGNYDMGYNENVLTGGASFHREKGYANGTREGSYGYTTRNGLIRIVTYVADQDGYRAQLLTNEPGVAASNPSNVAITKEQEPDPEALTQVPTGYVDPQNVGLSGSNIVKDYVLSGSDKESGDVRSTLGSAQVAVASPFGAYQYFL